MENSVLELFANKLTERRRGERFRMELSGWCKTVTKEYPCQTLDVSSFSVAIRTQLPAQIGERITVNLDAIGKIEGRIARRLNGGWAIRVQSPLLHDVLARKIAKLAIGMAVLGLARAPAENPEQSRRPVALRLFSRSE